MLLFLQFRHFANKLGNLERPFLKEFFHRWVETCGCPIVRYIFSLLTFLLFSLNNSAFCM